MAAKPREADPTRARLIQAALEQFSQHGIEAVSLRTITAAAGAANQSAVHYHFRNKLGLIEAVLDEVNARLAPLQAEALLELEQLAAQRRPTVRDIVAIGFAPYVLLFQQSREGRSAIRFLSRLTWQAGDEAQTLLITKVRPYFLEFEQWLRRALPHKPESALGFHVYLGINTLIHGLSDITLLGHEPRSIVSDLYRKRPAELLEYFYDYISAGLAAAGVAVETPRTALRTPQAEQSRG